MTDRRRRSDESVHPAQEADITNTGQPPQASPPAPLPGRDHAGGVTPRPWDARPDETMKAYRAFMIYRDLGPGRSLHAVSRELAKSVPLLKRWSSRYDWVGRARAFDVEAARLASVRSLGDHAAVRERQASLGRLLQARGGERLSTIDPRDLSPGDAVRAIRAGAQIESAALGITNVVHVSQSVTGEVGVTVHSWQHVAREAGIDSSDILAEVERLVSGE